MCHDELFQAVGMERFFRPEGEASDAESFFFSTSDAPSRALRPLCRHCTMPFLFVSVTATAVFTLVAMVVTVIVMVVAMVMVMVMVMVIVVFFVIIVQSLRNKEEEHNLSHWFCPQFHVLWCFRT